MISVDKQIRTHVCNQVNNKIYGELSACTNIPIHVEIIKQIRFQVYTQIFRQMYDKVRYQVSEEIS
jgi:hypothetical protein